MVQVPHVANDHRGFLDVPALGPFADVKDRRVRFGSDAVAQDHCEFIGFDIGSRHTK